MASKLDHAIVLQTLSGYAVVNQITETERRTRLQTMTDAEARTIFAALYVTWKKTGRQAGGNWEALARQKLEYHLQLRRAFETLARHKGWL